LPNWDSLPPHYLSPAPTTEPICKSLLPLLERVQLGWTFRFRLRANPTKKVAPRDAGSGLHAKGKRVDLRNEADQRAWLERKAQQHGFTVGGLHVNDEPRLTSRFSHQSGSGPIVVAPVLYQGILQVTDAAAFHQTLEEGIGPGKAYGCGLLSVAPF
jgi:CRISPR system Cascade subunit CasE